MYLDPTKSFGAPRPIKMKVDPKFNVRSIQVKSKAGVGRKFLPSKPYYTIDSSAPR
jgi:hypothetical protein